MRGAHMDPEGGVAMGREVGCKRMVPMHWGTFILSFEPFDEPRQRTSTAGNQSLVMKIGETLKMQDILTDGAAIHAIESAFRRGLVVIGRHSRLKICGSIRA